MLQNDIFGFTDTSSGPNVRAGEASVCHECEAGSHKYEAGKYVIRQCVYVRTYASFCL